VAKARQLVDARRASPARALILRILLRSGCHSGVAGDDQGRSASDTERLTIRGETSADLDLVSDDEPLRNRRRRGSTPLASTFVWGTGVPRTSLGSSATYGLRRLRPSGGDSPRLHLCLRQEALHQARLVGDVRPSKTRPSGGDSPRLHLCGDSPASRHVRDGAGDVDTRCDARRGDRAASEVGGGVPRRRDEPRDTLAPQASKPG
jgi:hypothetical protein